eukprot:2533894-Prorocentrum_lima.AAC.1
MCGDHVVQEFDSLQRLMGVLWRVQEREDDPAISEALILEPVGVFTYSCQGCALSFQLLLKVQFSRAQIAL